MAEEGHVINDSNGSSSQEGIESKIKAALISKIPHFRKNLESFTLKDVRRVLEKDLDLEEFAMDKHKIYIAQCFDERHYDYNPGGILQLMYNDWECFHSPIEPMSFDPCINGAEDDDEPNNCGDSPAESPKGRKSKNHVNETGSENEEKLEESPVLGLMTGHKTTKNETKNTPSVNDEVILDESIIKKAIGKRVSYIKDNLEKMTMAGLRRLLEEDLKLEKRATDPFKDFISKELDKILASFEASENSASSGNSSGEEEDKVKPKKKVVSKRKTQNTGELKKRKKPENDSKVSIKKNIKSKKTKLEYSSGEKDSVVDSEDDNSQSSAEKPGKKKEVSTPAYGKHVEHLKSVIKACGLSVPPVIYKKVKQAAEEKREVRLIKELEEILSKEGLSSNPSEKEIKEVRKKKEKAKELEGIDTSNIISSSRRRSRGSFIPPPKPQIPDESDNSENSDENEDEDNDEDSDGDGSGSEEVPDEGMGYINLLCIV
ncbi:hypothetical protein ACFE04_025733 [Oxalis oulophora]